MTQYCACSTSLWSCNLRMVHSPSTVAGLQEWVSTPRVCLQSRDPSNFRGPCVNLMDFQRSSGQSSWKREAAGPKGSSPASSCRIYVLLPLPACSLGAVVWSCLSGCLPCLIHRKSPEQCHFLKHFPIVIKKKKGVKKNLPVNQIFLNFPLFDLDWVKHLKIMLRSSNQSESNRVGSNSLWLQATIPKHKVISWQARSGKLQAHLP